MDSSLHTLTMLSSSAGVAQVSFWPGDPEISMLSSAPPNHTDLHGPASPSTTEEAALDAVAVEKLKSNSRPHIGVVLQPPAPGLLQFVKDTSRGSDFLERMADDDPELNVEELFNRSPLLIWFFLVFRLGANHVHLSPSPHGTL